MGHFERIFLLKVQTNASVPEVCLLEAANLFGGQNGLYAP